jgi:chromosome segregation ATPase
MPVSTSNRKVKKAASGARKQNSPPRRVEPGEPTDGVFAAITELEAQLQSTTEENGLLRKDLENIAQERVVLDRIIQKQSQTLSSLEASLTESQALHDEVRFAQTEKTGDAARVGELQQKRRELARDLTLLAPLRDIALKELDDIKSASDRIEERVGQLEDVPGELERLLNARLELQDALNVLREREVGIRAQLNDTIGETRARAADSEAARGTIERLERDLALETDNMDFLERENQELTAQSGVLRKAIEVAEREALRLEEDVASARGENKRLTDELDQSRNAMDRVSSSLKGAADAIAR